MTDCRSQQRNNDAVCLLVVCLLVVCLLDARYRPYIASSDLICLVKMQVMAGFKAFFTVCLVESENTQSRYAILRVRVGKARAACRVI
jgi:hypothetical protein